MDEINSKLPNVSSKLNELNTEELTDDKNKDKDYENRGDENDDETTMEEEEALPELEDPLREIKFLEEESNMPIHELMKMYGYTNGALEETAHAGNKNTKKRSLSKKNKNKKLKKVSVTTIHKIPEKKIKLREEDKFKQEKLNEEGSTINESVLKDTEGATEDQIKINKTVDSKTNVDECDEETETPSKLLDLYLAELDQVQSEEEDEDYKPHWEIHWKSVNVGLNFQALVTDGLSTYGDALPYENNDELLWDPNVLCEELIEDYLVKIQHITKALKPSNKVIEQKIRDNEKALYLLVQCGHDVAEAIRRMSLNVIPTEKSLSVWSEDETQKFEMGLILNGKNFHAIQKEVKTRSVAELVHFYYFWKKSERHDQFERKQVQMRPELKQWQHWDSEEDSEFEFQEKTAEDIGGNVIVGDKAQMNCLIYADRKRQIEN
ncbi:mesoderm induction early response protein 1-like isoform X2 [Daktulosphaira vitifoliae]|uniref:mesoderm induction early response protein 1-like isoform X2 n=1 Tax=Daktulosphaira vitifoliae TaxID=58002 RepID=UPI0021A99218|nr:mesoderm induction early response protein 1-like isoform X2 [Daktulosphaira vitifoliae]